MPIPSKFSNATSRSVIATTGVPRIMMTLVAYCAQMKSGSRNQVIPGARILWMVVRKFTPVRMEEKPLMNTPERASAT